MKKMALRSKGESGTSLLEVLLVLVLVSVLGGIAFSLGTATLDDYRLDRNARLLLSDLRESREKAIAENVWQEIKVYPSVNMYRLLSAGQRVRDLTLATGIRFVSGPMDFYFDPRGIPSQGETIILANQRGRSLRIILAPVTGRLRISP